MISISKTITYKSNRKTPIKYIIENECWVCVSHKKDKDGYCQIKLNGKASRLHRFIYLNEFGGDIKDKVIRHKCDNRACINPDHLEIGDHNDNVQDRVKRNRSAIGEANGRHKLTVEQVKEIRSDETSTKRFLADKYGVDPAIIRRIKNNQIWKTV